MDIDDSSQSSDVHVSVVETSTGKTLTGDDAPLSSELESWLECHPGWEVVRVKWLLLLFNRKGSELINYFNV